MGQHRHEGAAECVVVQRPRVVWLAETALASHTDAVLARHRSEIMTDLAKTLSGAGVTASVSMAEPSGAALARRPSAPRAGSWSASPPPKVSPTVPRRSSQVIRVAGACSARSANATSAVNAECPLAAITTCRSATAPRQR
jgi:hypothetical protein